MAVTILLLAAALAHAEPSCLELARHGRLLRQAQAKSRPWGEVRQAFLTRWDSERDNPAAARAARALREMNIQFADLPVTEAVGRPSAALYDPTLRLIALDNAELDPLWEAWGDPQERRAELALTVDRLAPILVHELAHARLREELGQIPPFSEEELIADAEETLYLRARLKSEPRYLEKSPLEWREEHEQMVRGMNRGYDAFTQTLREGGVLDGPSIFSLDESQRRRLLAESRSLREAHQRCADTSDWVARLQGEESTFSSSDRLAALAARYQQLISQQRRELSKN